MNVTNNPLTKCIQNTNLLFLTSFNVLCGSTIVYIENILNILHAKIIIKSKKTLLKVLKNINLRIK